MPIEVLTPVIVALLSAAGIVFGWFGWIWKQFQQWRHRNDAEPFPARLTCSGDTGFHPSAGFHEGLHIEIYNESEQAVHIKGFGLELSMQAQGSWTQEEFVSVTRATRSRSGCKRGRASPGASTRTDSQIGSTPKA